ncbi:MAG: HNH endonuclease [Methylobacter sp.]|nr:HNH endonuclease [Methylobacter sp.]
MINKIQIKVVEDNKSGRNSHDVIESVRQNEAIPQGDMGAYLVGVFPCRPLTLDENNYGLAKGSQWDKCIYKKQWTAALRGKDEFTEEQKALILAALELIKDYPAKLGKDSFWWNKAITQPYVQKLLESWSSQKQKLNSAPVAQVDRQSGAEEISYLQSLEVSLPEEIADAGNLVEGAVRTIIINAYERNPEARQRCITAHGSSCCICGFNFGVMYGSDAEGYIHVHHIRPLNEIKGEYVVNPIEDLRPVCPNCHAVLHLGGRCRSIEEVLQLLKNNNNN